jgi:signal peptidase II
MVGGSEYLFFQPIFNIADSAITVGVIAMLLFYRKQIGESERKLEPADHQPNQD